MTPAHNTKTDRKDLLVVHRGDLQEQSDLTIIHSKRCENKMKIV